MMKIFGLFATPLGYVMRWIYDLIPNYFLTMFVFTLLVRLVVFPLSIKTQKGQADRARLAPRIERLQKKYANDRQKLQQKTQELYEKENISLAGGCLPTLVQMFVLMSIIAVIYKPLTYVQRMPAEDLSICVEAVQTALTDGMEPDSSEYKKIVSQYSENSYYREMYLLKNTEQYEQQITDLLLKRDRTEAQAVETIHLLQNTQSEFSIFGISLLGLPSETGIRPNWLWIIAILSGVSALLSSILSMHYSNMAGTNDQQQMNGCTGKGMMYGMPLFSLIISFTVPAGVAVYWIFSNLLAMVQTVVLNKMFDMRKIRAEAEAEYAERRRKKAEDRERLKAARLEEQAAWQREENEKRAAKEGKRPPEKKKPAQKDETDGASETPADAEERTDE